MKRLRFDTFPTPCGNFSIALDDSGAIVATAFGGLEALRARWLHGGPGSLLRRAFGGQAALAAMSRDPAALSSAREQIEAYFAGARRTFDLPLARTGTDFQREVWAALQRIPFGTTCSYGQLAAAIGRHQSARSVGRANATNPICLIVPCHRVIGADGSPTGFAFGMAIKMKLLEFERSVPALSPAA